MDSGLRSAICAAITEATGQAFVARITRGAIGGSIHESYVVEDESRRYFVKTNSASALPQFAAEARGLSLILASGTVRAPTVVCTGDSGDFAFLVLEYLALKPASTGGQAQLGRAIAELHGNARNEKEYGLDQDNFIGATVQINSRSRDWVEFFRERRLRFQLELAAKQGYGQALKSGDRLIDKLGGLFTDYTPRPSLLHGDLWSGNAGELDGGVPVIFDPAVYVGDRETDLAMTELFGGFSPAFYAAYNEVLPLDSGYGKRRILYQLYHVLNHLNLFGGAYLSQAQHMLAQLNAELG